LYLAARSASLKEMKSLLAKGAIASDRIVTDPRHLLLLPKLKNAQRAQHIAELLKTNTPVNDPIIEGGKLFPLIKIFSNEFAVEAFKGMIFAHGLPRKIAYEFIKKVKGADNSIEILNQLEKDLLFDTDGLLDMVELLAVSELFQDKEFTCGEGAIKKLEDFADRASYYESLEAAHQAIGVNREELHKKYPHPLDTETAKTYLNIISRKSKAEKIAVALTYNPHLVNQMEFALEKNILPAETAYLFQQTLMQYLSAAAIKEISSIEEECSAQTTTKHLLSYEEDELPMPGPKRQTLEEETGTEELSIPLDRGDTIDND
jgi:hypothetical protein